MKTKRKLLVLSAIACLAALGTATLAGRSQFPPRQSDEELLRVREGVWRTWGAGDTKTLEQMVTPQTIVMSGGEPQWRYQADVLRSSSDFHAKGGKIVRLEFPRTEIQHFGDVAIIWSDYLLELEMDGKRSTEKSRVTEIFVRENGHWTNPGWHTDPEK